MGRKKIKIEPIQEGRNRQVTYLKRKAGLFKKAHELATLTDSTVAVIVFGHNGRLSQFCSEDMDKVMLRYADFEGNMESKGPRDFIGGKDDDEDDDDDDKPNHHKTRGGPSGGPSRRGGGGGGGAGPSGGNSGSGDAPHGPGPYDGDDNGSGPSGHPGNSGSGSRGDDKSFNWRQDGAGTSRKRGNGSSSSSRSSPDDEDDDEDADQNDESLGTSPSPSGSKDSGTGEAKERLRAAMLAKSRRASPIRASSNARSPSNPRGRNLKTKQALVEEEIESGQPSLRNAKPAPSVFGPGPHAAFHTSGPALVGPSSQSDALVPPVIPRQGSSDGLVRRHPMGADATFAGPPSGPMPRTNSMGMLPSGGLGMMDPGANSAPVSYNNSPYSSKPSTPVEGGSWVSANGVPQHSFYAEGPPEMRRNSFSQPGNLVPYGTHDGRPNTTGVLMDRNGSMQSMQHPGFAGMVPSRHSMMAGYGIGHAGVASSRMGHQILQHSGEMSAGGLQSGVQMQDEQQQQLVIGNGHMQAPDQAFYAPFGPNAQGLLPTGGGGVMSQGMGTATSDLSRSGSVSSASLSMSRPGTDDYNSGASAPSACDTPLFGPLGIPPVMGSGGQLMSVGDSVQSKEQGSDGKAAGLNEWCAQTMLPGAVSSGASSELLGERRGFGEGLDMNLGPGKFGEGGGMTTMTSAGPTTGSQLMQAGLHSFSPPTHPRGAAFLGNGGDGSEDVFGGGFADC